MSALPRGELLLEKKEKGVAQVMVFDFSRPGQPRYGISKYMMTPAGRFVITYAYRRRRDAALNYARAWFDQRVKAVKETLQAGVPASLGGSAS